MNQKINKRKVGSEYETLACEYLESRGIKVLERNFRVKIGEIDIIGMDAGTLVFVEVKFRSDLDHGGAYYAIDHKKQQVIRRVAQWYMSRHHIGEETYCRFDAVLIDGDEITHIKNAW